MRYFTIQVDLPKRVHAVFKTCRSHGFRKHRKAANGKPPFEAWSFLPACLSQQTPRAEVELAAQKTPCRSHAAPTIASTHPPATTAVCSMRRPSKQGERRQLFKKLACHFFREHGYPAAERIGSRQAAGIHAMHPDPGGGSRIDRYNALVTDGSASPVTPRPCAPRIGSRPGSARDNLTDGARGRGRIDGCPGAAGVAARGGGRASCAACHHHARPGR
ncbi:hypothetical protein SEVIR_9G415350v4 [Setaria viridis]